MAMTKFDALRVIGLNGNPAAQWVGNVLLTGPRFSSHSAKRLKLVALMVTLDINVDLTKDWQPVVGGYAMNWEKFDIAGASLYKQQITKDQFLEVIGAFGQPYRNDSAIPPGLGRMLLDMLRAEQEK